MNILGISPYPLFPVKSGGQLSIAKFYHYLSKVDAVYLVGTQNNTDDPLFEVNQLKLFAPTKKRYLPFLYQRKLERIIEEKQIDVLICEHPYMGLSVHALAKKFNLPWCFRSHNIEHQRFKSLGKPWWKILSYYESWVMRHADATLFVSEEDKAWATQALASCREKFYYIPFGSDLEHAPQTCTQNKSELALRYGLNQHVPWLYFLGALDYRPNEHAVEMLINEIIPRLKEELSEFEVILLGKGLNAHLQKQIQASDTSTHYLGFVDRVHDFIMASQVMLNPVILGGGVKTKVVEALAYNKNVVSTLNGAIGIQQTVCGDKLRVVNNEDWKAFVTQIIASLKNREDIATSFYQEYSWKNIAQRVHRIMEQVLRKV